MGAKLKSKTHLLNAFFYFLSRFLCFWLQSFQKVLIWPKKIIFYKNQKRYQKTQNFTLISNPLKKFSTDSKSAWNSALFDTHIEFFNKKFFLLLLALFVNFDCKCAGNKKTENLFLWMCLRILLGNHRRVFITKLLKSLYPIWQLMP